MVNQVLNIFSAIVPVANLAVVHEGPVLPNKRMAVTPVDRCASSCANMGKK